MFPLFDTNNRPVGFSGRIYNTSDTSKYINTKETPIFKKGEILYNYYKAKEYVREKKSVIVTNVLCENEEASTVLFLIANIPNIQNIKSNTNNTVARVICPYLFTLPSACFIPLIPKKTYNRIKKASIAIKTTKTGTYNALFHWPPTAFDNVSSEKLPLKKSIAIVIADTKASIIIT